MAKKCTKTDFRKGHCVKSNNSVSLSTIIAISSLSTIIGIVASIFLVTPISEFLLYVFPTAFASSLAMFVLGLTFLLIGIFLSIYIKRNLDVRRG